VKYVHHYMIDLQVHFITLFDDRNLASFIDGQMYVNGRLCARHCDELYAGKVLMTDIDLNVV
jgi:hypothetical protein